MCCVLFIGTNNLKPTIDSCMYYYIITMKIFTDNCLISYYCKIFANVPWGALLCGEVESM